jgi:hypothetical protein
VLVTAYLASVAWRIWLSRSVTSPTVVDESRYMVFARVLAGGPGGVGGDTEATRRAGYALLISPAWWITSDPTVAYRLIQTLNALINALTLPLAYLLARRVFGSGQLWAIAVALVASSLPAAVFFAPLAVPNAVLPPLLLGWLLALQLWIRTTSTRAGLGWSVAAGAIVGFMSVVHVRALILVGAQIVVAVALLATRRVRPVETAATAAGAAATFAVHPILMAALSGQVATGGTEPEDRMLATVTTVEGFVRLVSDACGQIWYLCIATWGLAAIGLVVTVASLAGRRGLLDRSSRYVLSAALASTVLIALVTSAALPDDGKVSNHFYPGYIIFVAPVWVVAGLTGLRGTGWRPAIRVAVATAAVVATTWFVVASHTIDLGPLGPPNVFSPIDAPEALFLSPDGATVMLTPITFIVVTIAGATALLLAPRRGVAAWIAALVLAMGLNVAANQAANERTAAIARAAEDPGLPGAGVHPGDTVAYHRELLTIYRHQLQVGWGRVILLDARTDPVPPEATILVTGWEPAETRTWAGSTDPWHRVGGDPSSGYAVWRR